VAEHLKAVGGEIDRRVRLARGPQLVIVAPEELRSEIESSLSAEARESIVGWASAEAHAAPPELLEVARPHLDAAHAARVNATLERWREERGKNARASAGWPETLAAASDGRVEMLLLAAGADRQAYRCPTCGRAEASGGDCPLDGVALEPTAGGDLAVHQTLAHGGLVLTVPGDLVDDGADGIGALLRF
jgi:peptide subunit release factor 1 (eRF1)